MDGSIAKKESQVQNAFARLDKTLDQLSDLVAKNESGLVSVLRDEPSIGEKESVDKEKQVPLASMLANIDDRLHIIINKLASVQRRLEL